MFQTFSRNWSKWESKLLRKYKQKTEFSVKEADFELDKQLGGLLDYYDHNKAFKESIIHDYEIQTNTRKILSNTYVPTQEIIEKKALFVFLKRITEIEMIMHVFFCCFQSDKNFKPTVENIWSYLPNFPSILPPLTSDKEMSIKDKNILLDIARIYFKTKYTDDYWKEEIKFYESVPKVLRLFILVKNDSGEPIYLQNHPNVFSERLALYTDLLTVSSVYHVKRKVPFLSLGEVPFFYTRDVRSIRKQDKEKYRVNITHSVGSEIKKGFPEFLFGSDEVPNGSKDFNQLLNKFVLPSGRKKVPRSKLHLLLDNKTENHWTDNGIQLIEEHYRNTLASIKKRDFRRDQTLFNLRTPEVNSLLYKDKTAIGARVAVGKSTLMQLEIARLTNLWEIERRQLSSSLKKEIPISNEQHENGAKIGIWTTKVEDALIQVYKLYLIGVKAVPLIGSRDMKKHLANFIKRVQDETSADTNKNPLSTLALNYVLKFFKGECSLVSLTGCDNMSNPPCIDLKVSSNPLVEEETKENKTERNEGKWNRENREEAENENEEERLLNRACPLFETCGKYTIERELRTSSVWVGTIQAFLFSKPMPLVNPQNMTYAEISYEELDVIFIDEGDDMQEKADDAFLSENPLIGRDHTLFERNFLSLSHKLDSQYQLVGNPIQKSWRHHSHKASDYSHLLYEILKKSPYVRKKIKNKTFGVHNICKELTMSIFEKEPSRPIRLHLFFRLFSDIQERFKFNNIWNEGQKLDKEMDNVERAFKEMKVFFNNLEEITQMNSSDEESFLSEFELLLDNLFNKILNIIDCPANHQKFIADRNGYVKKVKEYFYFMILLIHFDAHFKQLIARKPSLEILLNEKIEDINAAYSFVRPYLPFIPDSPTGKHFQYFYKESDDFLKKGEELGILQTYDYLGIGRDIMTEFSSLYQNLTHVEYHTFNPLFSQDYQSYARSFAHEGSTGPSMVFMSATLYAEGSSHFHVDVGLDYLLEPRKSESIIRIELLPVYEIDEYTTDENDLLQPIFNSGSKNKRKSLEKTTERLAQHIEEQLYYWKERNENRKVILTVNSYEQCKFVLERAKRVLPDYKIMALTNESSENPEEFVLTGEVEYIALQKPDVLIAPIWSLNRAYNILKYNEEKKEFTNTSYFGSIFFLLRPIIPFDSIENIIKILNGKYKKLTKEIEKDRTSFRYAEGIAYIRRETNQEMYKMLSYHNYWTSLSYEDKEILTWFVMVNIRQMVGRLQRGQTDVNVFFVDAAFAREYALDSGKADTAQNSILKIMEQILEREWENNTAKEILYGDWLRALKNITYRGEEL